MKAHQTSILATTACTAWIFAFAMTRPALSEPLSKHNASALLDEAKKGEYERKIAAKQTEMDRLNEDQKKAAAEMEKLDKSVQKIGAAADDSAKQLELLTSQKKRVTAEQELLSLRIEAERLRGEGLRMLQSADRKAHDAVAKRNEETDARAAVVAAETRQLAAKTPETSGASGPGKAAGKNEPSLTELRRKLDKAMRATSTAESAAREAMASATTRVQQAEVAAAKAEKKQAEIAQEKTP